MQSYESKIRWYTELPLSKCQWFIYFQGIFRLLFCTEGLKDHSSKERQFPNLHTLFYQIDFNSTIPYYRSRFPTLSLELDILLIILYVLPMSLVLHN
jgi:hypothetical protein